MAIRCSNLPEKPRYIIIGIRKDKSADQEKNPPLFDHVDVAKMSMVMNDTEYPALNINTNFTKNQYMQFYKMMSDFPEISMVLIRW